ncbi:hypothetical protein V6N13_042668 [Hibiscus sabdariffa]
MKDWIKLCRSVEVECNSVGFVMHYFDNCLDRRTKGMPRRRQRVLPGRVLDIFYLGGKFCCLGGKFCSRRETLLSTGKSARFCSNLPWREISCLAVSAENHLPMAWAGKSAALTESLLPAVSAESPAWAGKSTLAGNMPDSAQLCRDRFTNSALTDVIVAANLVLICCSIFCHQREILRRHRKLQQYPQNMTK